MSAANPNWEHVAREALRVLGALDLYEDFGEPVTDCEHCVPCCGYSDASGINAARAEAKDLLREMDEALRDSAEATP